MAQPNLALLKPKKKKIPRKPTPKQQAKEKYEKRLEEFKVFSHETQLLIAEPCGTAKVEYNWHTEWDTKSQRKEEGKEIYE